MEYPRPSLLVGEHILWEGAPPTGVMVRAADALLIPFSLLWGGFAMFWNVSVWRDGAPVFFRLWGLPFLLVGFYIVIGRFLIDMLVRRRQRYYVTNQRVLIERRGWGGGLRTLDIRHLPLLATTVRADGSGTLSFGQTASLFSAAGHGSGMGFWHPALDPTLQFLGIANVAQVRSLVERAARA
jgi:hypothetical protein